MSAATPPANSNPSPGPSRHMRLVAILILIAGVAIVWLMLSVFPRKVGPDPNPGVAKLKYSAQERSEFLALRNKAIGHLENDEWVDALQVLKQIEAKLPNDLFAPRNMAAAMCGQKSFGGNDLNPIQPEEAEAAAQLLLKAAPDDYASYLLSARIAVGCRQQELATERFRKATQMAPNNPNPWFEYYKNFATGFSKEANPEALDAIKKCHEAAPNNIIATMEYLNSLATHMDPQLLEVLQSKTQLIEQLRRFVQVAKYDPRKYFDEALRLLPNAIQSKDANAWRAVAGQLRFMNNVMMANHVYLTDLSKLQPNPLEFMRFRFSTDELNGNDLPATLPPAIDVAFVESAEHITLPSNPRCVQVADFNLDQQPDLFVLTKGKLQIFGMPTPADDKKLLDLKNLPWQSLAEITVDETMTTFILADLDLDAVDVMSSGPNRPIPNVPEPNSTAQPKVKSVRKANKFVPGDATTICQQADPDLVLYGPGGIQVWKNELPAKDGTRTYIKAENTGLEEVRNVELICAADFDLEGDLDLLVVSAQRLALWSNREQFTFKDVSSFSLLPQDLRIRQIIPVDWDRDVALDFVLIGEPSKGSQAKDTVCGVLRNQLHGKLRWEASLDGTEKGAQVPEIGHAVLLDADANSSWDLAVTSQSTPRLIRTQTQGAGNLKLIGEAPLPGLLTGGLVCLDYDNDGYPDLLSWQGQTLQMIRGSSSGQFADVLFKLPESSEPIRNCLAEDFDRDGDQDLVVMTENGVQLLVNEGGNKNHWLKIRLRARPIMEGSGAVGQAMRRVNHQGVGSLVEVKTQGYYQPQVATGETLHFGLGDRTKVELLRVLWTNGVPQGLLELEGNVEICEIQAPKGSCPFVYTWNGEHFEFYTDLLWNAPLGLQFAEGVVAQPRAWEYLKIDGDRMHLKDGEYVMQVTEELWEATYFDQIELLAIDHPAEVDIYSNEKVGPPELAEFKIHTVREPHHPVAAQDQQKRDVLHQILKEDGDFTKTYDRKFRQGLTEQHWLELDLGQIEKTGPITLFLTGWMYPTETSISVGVSQNAANAQARPPALWVPDAKGEWKEIRPFMGFPGGKTKTIAIDLTGVFAGNDHRLRIVTNMEFYWDHAFFTVGEKPAEVRKTPLKLTSADLHFRGVSQHYWRPGNGPDQYDYRYAITSPVWPPMQGNFTRFGEVLELLTEQDDRLVVIGAGDEITLTFATPETPLPKGWKRDFIMHNVGWDKDADLHTLYGQIVEPLPFNAMSGYPFAPHEGPEDTSKYRDYLEKYQTREQSHSKFWHLVKQRK